jgi:hypothetical protein
MVGELESDSEEDVKAVEGGIIANSSKTYKKMRQKRKKEKMKLLRKLEKARNSRKAAELPLLRLIRGSARYVHVTSHTHKVDMAKDDKAASEWIHPLGLAEDAPRVSKEKHMEELATYKKSVLKEGCDVMASKQKMLKDRFIEDLCFAEVQTWRLVKCVLLWFVALFARIPIHYGGEWMVVKAMSVSVYTFKYYFYKVDLTYNSDILPPMYETGVIAAGWLANTTLFTTILSTLLVCRWLIGWYPSWISYVMVVYGVAMLLDPLLVLAVDLLTGNTKNGDAFKMYTYYEATEGNGLAGLFLTLVAYLVAGTVNVIIYYYYVAYVHKAGRILDLHDRLFRKEDEISMPHDMEVSLRTLRWVTNAAQRYTDSDGKVRKVFSKRYAVHDHLAWGSSEYTVHLAVFDVTLAGDKSLHRHFIRTHNGETADFAQNLFDFLF